jgi:hypothetical protein
MSDRGESRELKRLVSLERNQGKEEIRWSFDEFTPSNGQPTKYISGRKWYRADDGEWRPTKAGVTIRLAELDRVVEALQRVQHARDAKGNGASAERPRRSTEHRERAVQNATDAEIEADSRLF